MSLSERLNFSPTNEIPLLNQQLATLAKIRSKVETGEYEYEDVSCFCGENEGTVIAERDRYGLPVKTILCMNCGLMRTSPRLTKKATSKFYINEYRSLYSGSISKSDRFKDDYIRGQDLVEQMPSLMGQVRSVYDIGCGTGGALCGIRDAGKEVTGCDFDNDYIAMGRNHGIAVVKGGVKELLAAKKGEPADLVLLSHVVEHFLDLRTEIEEVIHAVRPGGFLLVLVPGIRCIPKDYYGNLLMYLQNAHTYHFTGPTLRYVLECIGLQVLISDESTAAACIRPVDWAPGAPMATPPKEEAPAILEFLKELERKHLASKE